MKKQEQTLQFRVKEILKEKGITIADFAEKAGLHYNTALSVVNGKYKRIGLDTLSQMCKALEVDVSELFTWE